MPEKAVGKLFKHGGSQAVRLPKEFRFPGERVKLTRVGRGVLIEPEEFDFEAWRAKLHELNDEPFMPDGREQPPMPESVPLFDE
ncbi:AbrB/MazE/SpoVT family DNA-binding domain-containing protein [Nostoc sp. NIES-2111]